MLRSLGEERGRIVPRHRRRRRSRPPGRRVPVLRDAAGRSERRRPARAPPRAARAAGVRRVGQPRGHEGRQHARHASSPRTAAASSATTCRTSVRRSAPARWLSSRRRRRVRVPVRGGHAGEAAAHVRVLPEPVADGRLRRTPGDRQVRRGRVRARGVETARARGGASACPSGRCALGGAAGDGVHGRRRSAPP